MDCIVFQTYTQVRIAGGAIVDMRGNAWVGMTSVGGAAAASPCMARQRISIYSRGQKKPAPYGL